MAKELNIRRLQALPSAVEPSTIYIIKSSTPGKVDLMFVGDDTTDVRSVLTIDDVNTRILEVLNTWVPARSYKADALSQHFSLTLTGSVQGSVNIDGSRNVTMVTTGGGGGGFPAPQMLLAETFQTSYSNIANSPIESCVIPESTWGSDSYGTAGNGIFTSNTYETDARLVFSADLASQIVERPYAVKMTLRFDSLELTESLTNNRVILSIGKGMKYKLDLSIDDSQTTQYTRNYTLVKMYKTKDWIMPLRGMREIIVYIYKGYQIVSIIDADGDPPSTVDYITYMLSTAPTDWSDFSLEFCKGVELHNLEIFTF